MGKPWEAYAHLVPKPEGKKEPWKAKFKPIDSKSTEELMDDNFQPSASQGFGVGGFLGLTANLGDEALGRISALKEIATTDKTMADYSDLVKQEVKTAREAFGHTRKKHPVATAGGEIAGNIALSSVPIFNASKGVALARYGRAGLQGAVSGYGASESEDAKGLLADAALGAGGQMIGQGIGEGVSKGLGVANETAKGLGSRTKDYLAERAQKRAWKASGAMLKDYRGLEHTGRLQEGGQTLLNTGVVKLGSTVKSVAEKASEFVDHYGKKMGRIQDALDSIFEDVKSLNPSYTFQPQKAANRLKTELVDKYKGTAMEDALGPVTNEINRLLDYGSDSLSFSKARKIITSIDEFVNHTKEQSPQLDLLKRARGILNDELDSKVEKTLGLSGDKKQYQMWKHSKKMYGIMKTAKDMAEDRLLRSDANRLVSPSDYGTAIGGGVIAAGASDKNKMENALKYGVLTGGVNRLGRTFGPAIGAKALQGASKMVPKGLLNEAGRLTRQFGMDGGTAKVGEMVTRKSEKDRKSSRSK